MDAAVSKPTQAPGHAAATLISSTGDVQALLGPPPLFRSEDKEAYGELLARVQASVQPKDIIEEFWVRDVVDLVWEALRLRRLKANLITGTVRKALAKVLRSMSYPNPEREASSWEAQDEGAEELVESWLKEYQYSMDVVMAQALRMRLDDIERIDRMITSAEMRRHAVLREVDRHRAALAEGLRRAAQNVQDAEFTEVGHDEAPA